MCLKWGTVGERQQGMGRKGGGGQYTVNQGPGWTGIAPRRKGGIPSKKGIQGQGQGFPSQGVVKRIGLCTPNHANLDISC